MRSYLPFLGINNVNDIILEILAEKKACLIKEIHAGVVEKIPVSYQAVHKALKILTVKNIIEKCGGEYKISQVWESKLRDFVEKRKG